MAMNEIRNGARQQPRVKGEMSEGTCFDGHPEWTGGNTACRLVRSAWFS